MSIRDRIRTLVRLLVLFAVLLAVALVSAITTIRLAIRGHQVEVPSLVGVPLEAAERATSGMGIELKIEDKLYSDQYPANQIVSQLPSPGVRIKVGQHIHVLVSLGPQHLTVPNLVGRSLRAAEISAIQRGLAVGEVVQVHLPRSTATQVLAQDPPPAQTDMRGPAVSFLVSAGDVPPAFLCPSFVGRPLSEARRALESAGLKLGELIPPQAGPESTVLSQSPPAGSKIGPDAVFQFQVGP